MNNELAVKALELIEDISGTLSCDTSDKILVDRKDLENIFSYAHVALGRCSNPHEDWKTDLIKTHKEVKDQNII